jgi:hypothetical protein
MTNKEINNILNEIVTPEVKKRADQIEMAIIKSRGEKIFNSKGAGAGKYIRATAINQAKKANEKEIEQSLQTPETEEMKEDKLREMVRAALSKPLDEKKARPDYPDIDKDGDREESMKKAAQDKKKMQMEDLDLGHEDNEPHMIKAELAQIGKYAMELYKMVDQFEGPQEVDFPAWWQSKITTAKNMISSAKHYLEFELEEPKIDAMVDVASEEGAIDEMSKKQIKKRGEIYDTLKSQGMSDEKAGKIATSKAMKMKEAIAKKLYEDANKIKKLEADLAKVKSQYYSVSDLPPEKETELRKQMGDIGRELKRARREDKTGSSGYGKPSSTQKIKEAILAYLKNK